MEGLEVGKTVEFEDGIQRKIVDKKPHQDIKDSYYYIFDDGYTERDIRIHGKIIEIPKKPAAESALSKAFDILEKETFSSSRQISVGNDFHIKRLKDLRDNPEYQINNQSYHSSLSKAIELLEKETPHNVSASNVHIGGTKIKVVCDITVPENEFWHISKEGKVYRYVQPTPIDEINARQEALKKDKDYILDDNIPKFKAKGMNSCEYIIHIYSLGFHKGFNKASAILEDD